MSTCTKVRFSGVLIDAAGVPVGPAVADAEHEVARQHRLVAVAVVGLQADHAGVQLVVVADRAPTHQGRDDRNPEGLGQFDEALGGTGVDDAATGDQHGMRVCCEHIDRLLGLTARCRGLHHRQRLVGVDVELDLGHLHVDRKVEQHGAGATGAHQLERLLEGTGNLRRLEHGHRHLGDRLRDRLDVDGLEVLLVELRDRRLAGDAEDRQRVRPRGVEPRDHVGSGGAGGTDTDADVAVGRTGEPVGHVGCALDVAGEGVPDAAVGAHRGIEGVDGGPWQAERLGGALLLQDGHGGVRRAHASHSRLLRFPAITDGRRRMRSA